MGRWTEQQVRDKLMDEFISHDPVDIVLHRPTWASTSAGGRSQTGDDSLAEQRFGIYPFKRRLTLEFHHNPQTQGEDKVQDIHYILIFNRDNDIQVDDFFYPENDLVAGSPAEGRLESGLYTVTFISARLWDRGQAGIRYRGE
jgi:hypothetical protein